jgi:hypothetical protein
VFFEWATIGIPWIRVSNLARPSREAIIKELISLPGRDQKKSTPVGRIRHFVVIKTATKGYNHRYYNNHASVTGLFWLSNGVLTEIFATQTQINVGVIQTEISFRFRKLIAMCFQSILK